MIRDHDVAIGTGFAQPIGAINRALAKGVVDPFAGLFNRICRQPQVDRATGFIAQPCPLVRVAAAVTLHVIKRPFHNDRKFVHEGRLERGKPVLGHADQRRCNRLMRPAFGGQRDAGRGADQHKAGVLVAGVVQCIEAARHERVIDRANGDQAFAKQGMRQACRAQQQHQVHLCDAQFDVLTVWGEFPFGGRGDFVILKGVRSGRACKQFAPIDPSPKACRAGDVRRCCDDPAGQIAVAFG